MSYFQQSWVDFPMARESFAFFAATERDKAGNYNQSGATNSSSNICDDICVLGLYQCFCDFVNLKNNRFREAKMICFQKIYFVACFKDIKNEGLEHKKGCVHDTVFEKRTGNA